MGDLNHVVSSLSVAAVPIADNGKKAGLNFKVYQELKSSVHRDLLNKIDVEKVATVRDERRPLVVERGHRPRDDRVVRDVEHALGAFARRPPNGDAAIRRGDDFRAAVAV